MNEDNYIGFLKYTGQSVQEGMLDIGKSADALAGFNEILRYFAFEEDPELKDVDFEIPVRVKKGSWEILIGGIGMIYLSSVANKAGKDGFFETGPAKDIKKIIKGAIVSAQWVIRIATHVRTFKKSKFENAKILEKENQVLIEIENDSNKSLTVPKKYFDLFVNCPDILFSKNAKIIEKERILELGVFDEDGQIEKISISESEKAIFHPYEEADENIVLPELEHGQIVELEGGITRATESMNTIGFRYQDHTIICKPKVGTIAMYKEKIVSPEEGHLFPKVKIKGIVDRTDKNGGFKEKRPMIIYDEIIPIHIENQEQSLF